MIEQGKYKKYPYYTNFIEYYLRRTIQGRSTPRGAWIIEKIRIWLETISPDDFRFLLWVFDDRYKSVHEAMTDRRASGQQWSKLHMMEDSCINYLDM